MSDYPQLTSRQQQILELIQIAIETTGAPPTRAEIATALGFKSANAAEDHLQALARKGVIELMSGTSRGIRVRNDVVRGIHAARHTPLHLSAPPALEHIALPLIGSVAAGSPILAQEHIDRFCHVDAHLFDKTPDYLLKVRGMSMCNAGIMDGDFLGLCCTKPPTALVTSPHD